MKVLYLQPGLGIGGSKVSLYQILKNAPSNQSSHLALALPPESEYERMLSRYVVKFHYLDLSTWQKYRRTTLAEQLKSPFSDAKRLSRLLPAIHQLITIIKKEKIDLIHTNNSICPAGAFAAKIAHKPHVWHIREPIGTTGQYPLILGDKLSAILIRWLSDVIICNSNYSARFFHQFGYSVRIITNGLDLQTFRGTHAQGDLIRRQLSGGKSGLVIAMVGNLTTQWKGHILFLEMAAQLNKKLAGCHFVVFGGNSNLDLTQYTCELKTRVEQLHLENVYFADFMNDIPAMMHSIDILVHPAATEGSGRVVMEAMAAGKAVVGVNCGGVQELIQDGITGFLVQPGNVQSLSDRVQFLIENPEDRISLGQRASQYAIQNFSNQTMMQSLQTIYRQLA